MKKNILTVLILINLLFSSCTQIITAPIEIAGATASAVIDIAGSTVHAVAGNDDDDKK